MPGFSSPVPLAAGQDMTDFLTSQIISYPGTPSPMFAHTVGAPIELFSLSPDFPLNQVEDYPDLGRVLDIYAYDNVQWQAPLESFLLHGTVHAAYADATATSEVSIAPQNLSAPTQAYGNQQGYGLP
jgi:hypothetical protein